MDIKYLGSQTILLRGKKESVLINPQKGDGKTNSRIIMFTDKTEKSEIDKEKVFIKGPGEYEIGGVEIKAWGIDEKNLIYLVEVDGVIIGIIGKSDQLLTDKMIEKISGIDVLIAGISETKLTGKILQDLAKKWGANYLIPIGFKTGDEVLTKFLDDVDEEGLEAIDSLRVDRDNLPDGLEISLLKC